MTGPSPRVREAVGQRVGASRVVRINLTGTGSSRTTGPSSLCLRNDTRRCGQFRIERDSELVEQGVQRPCTNPIWGPSSAGAGNTRGPTADPRPDDRVGGTIPTGTGSRTSRAETPPRSWDHPRGRGQQDNAQTALVIPSGPSPRTRRAALDVAAGRPHEGTIPMGAGNRACRPRLPCCRDHPCGCREQRGVANCRLVTSGLSPRVRGAGHPKRAHVGHHGTIPAGAGSRGQAGTG